MESSKVICALFKFPITQLVPTLKEWILLSEGGTDLWFADEDDEDQYCLKDIEKVENCPVPGPRVGIGAQAVREDLKGPGHAHNHKELHE
jgi:hypothetical protein